MIEIIKIRKPQYEIVDTVPYTYKRHSSDRWVHMVNCDVPSYVSEDLEEAYQHYKECTKTK